jgi:hypothetical protein
VAVELDEADELAISTAITKAVVAGFEQGLAALQFELERASTLMVDVRLVETQHAGYDGWAEKYRDDAD